MFSEPPSRTTDTNALLSRLRTQVLDRKPFLKNIIQKLGAKSLLEYVHGYADMAIHPVMRARQEEFLGTFEREVAQTLGPDIAQRARAQIKKTYFASTNDHHGPLNAFDAINAHIVLALSAMTDPKETAMDAIIVFSCCNVSLNNVTFPRGMLFHALGKTGIEQRRLSLLPSNAHACSLYGYRAYEPREIEKVLKLLGQNVREGMIPKPIGDKMEHLIREVFTEPAILKRKTYSAQASIVNDRLWNLVFKGEKQAPILVDIGQERLVERLLQDHHLVRDSIIHRMLFNPEYERLILKYFDGIYGAFSTKDNSGTHLFWGRSLETGLRLKMRKVGQNLVSQDGTLEIPWTPEAIALALKQKKLIPSILLVFSILSFYYGLKCLGGYSQVNYLTFMKEAFMAMMRELGENAAADACIELSTKNWSGFTFTYLRNGVDTVVPANFLDLYLYGDAELWNRLRDYSRVCTLNDAFQPILPEVYRYSYLEHEREHDLLALTAEQIAAAIGIRPCVRLTESVP